MSRLAGSPVVWSECGSKLVRWIWSIGGFGSNEGEGGEITESICRVPGESGKQSSAGELIERVPKWIDEAVRPGRVTTGTEQMQEVVGDQNPTI